MAAVATVNQDRRHGLGASGIAPAPCRAQPVGAIGDARLALHGLQWLAVLEDQFHLQAVVVTIGFLDQVFAKSPM